MMMGQRFRVSSYPNIGLNGAPVSSYLHWPTLSYKVSRRNFRHAALTLLVCGTEESQNRSAMRLDGLIRFFSQ